MKKKQFIQSCLLLLLFLAGLSNVYSQAQADSIIVENYFNQIKGNEVLLQQFFSGMPKGGDLHNHLTGSVYAETYFSLAVQDSLWVDMSTGRLSRTPPPPPSSGTIIQLKPGMENLHNVRMKLIDIWSIRNFEPYKSSLGADEYFFGTFGLFGAITDNHMVDLLRELRYRAARENVQYLEIMVTSPKISQKEIDSYFGKGTFDRQNSALKKAILSEDPYIYDTLASILSKWEEKPEMKNFVENYVHLYDSLDVSSQIPDSNAPTCLYQSYASRGGEPLAVFAQLYVSFKASLAPANKIVGVNIVAAEDGENSMTYYSGHMKMFRHLKATYSMVKTALHAGELTLGLVKPEDLGCHIGEAIYTAQANRIGHGVDIAFEKGSASLLAEMKQKKIPVEINLTSNEFILGVKGNEHPFLLYRKAGVPTVISTDDPGILRTNLTEQYVLLPLRYSDVSYVEIKQLIRNGIIYSFAPDYQKKRLLDKTNRAIADFERLWATKVKQK
jgi:adenosine deaminase